jgi:hypothetical protein
MTLKETLKNINFVKTGIFAIKESENCYNKRMFLILNNKVVRNALYGRYSYTYTTSGDPIYNTTQTNLSTINTSNLATYWSTISTTSNSTTYYSDYSMGIEPSLYQTVNRRINYTNTNLND